MVESFEDTQRGRLTSEQLLDAWPILDTEERLDGFRLLPREDAEDFFLELSSRGQASVLTGMVERERRLWLRLMPPDDVADLLVEFPIEDRAALCELLERTTLREVNALLAYAEDEAGGLMNPRFARVRPDMSVEEAIRYIRRQARENLETIYYIYVLDSEQRMLGVVSVRELLLAPGSRAVREVMHADVISVPEEMDQEEVARIIAQHDILAVPVVDAESRVKGIVTVDDVVDVVEDEATEDIQKIGGSVALDAPYLQTPIREMVHKRAGWLVVLLIGGMFTSFALKHYEDRLASILVLLLPLILSSGGNTGSQSATLVVRAMALDQVRMRDWWRIVRRELASGLVLGAILASLGMLGLVAGHFMFDLTEHYLWVGYTLGLALLAVVMFGTLVGALLPLVLRRLGFDPASASAPMVATLLDVSGVLIYFNLASLMLAGKVL